MRTPQEIATAFAETDRLDDARRYWLVGIGGAGMSAIARLLRSKGLDVAGSDNADSPLLDHLRTLGIQVQIGHDGAGLRDGDAVIVSDAIPLQENSETAKALKVGLPLFRRSQALGWLLRGRKTIAVTGTHGKTTTTGMIARILLDEGLDPLVVVGAEVPEFGGAVVEGNGEWAVIEACEAYDGFHDLDPEIAVVTNLELDHADFHGTYERLADSVTRFLRKAPSADRVLIPEGDANAEAAAMDAHPAIEPTPMDRDLPDLALPGEHNRMNASLAVAAAQRIGVAADRARTSVAAFRGAERRLQVLYDGDVTVVDDYAHHPTEISASIRALRERYPGRRLVVVYQPHLYSRTAALLPEFADALSAADELILTDIYPAREDPIPGLSSGRIAELATTSVRYVPCRQALPYEVAHWLRSGDVVVGMGAGTIGEFAPALVQRIARSGPLYVALIYGGDSPEREVSLLSRRAVERALRSQGHRVVPLDVSAMLLSHGRLDALAGGDRPDVAFLAVHGGHGEDGSLQGLLELLHLPYTGSGVQACAMAMDKSLAKSILAASGLPVPQGILVTTDTSIEGAPCPAVVKPASQGSTVGLRFVQQRDELGAAIRYALQFDRQVLVEEWLQGIEISVPVLGDRALPAVEIVPASGRYDFESKYAVGATEEIVPARLDAATAARAADYALRAHQALGCRGATRTDMIVTAEGPVLLEVNTLPGLTETSLLPRSAAAAGISFEALVQWMIDDAWERRGT